MASENEGALIVTSAPLENYNFFGIPNILVSSLPLQFSSWITAIAYFPGLISENSKLASFLLFVLS
jgi:hypothetical protein